MRPLLPLPLSVLRFTGIQSYSYTDQRKVEANVEVAEDRTGDLLLRKPRTSQLSHDCSYIYTTLLLAHDMWNQLKRVFPFPNSRLRRASIKSPPHLDTNYSNSCSIYQEKPLRPWNLKDIALRNSGTGTRI